jgi:hypothetical protein
MAFAKKRQLLLAESYTPLINVTKSTTYLLAFRWSVEVASRLISALLVSAHAVYEPFILSQAYIQGMKLHF